MPFKLFCRTENKILHKNMAVIYHGQVDLVKKRFPEEVTSKYN